MIPQTILNEAQALQEKMVENRRFLHSHAEIGFELFDTVDFVKSKLREIGCKYTECGKSGITATIGKGVKKSVFLLRADMDALPLEEQSDLGFSCTNGNMHACGHDMHTSMLLGAAEILKKYESEIDGTVKLMFQPAEEVFAGASNMIENGVLKNPDVDAAMMLHVFAGLPVKTGTVFVPQGGVGAPAADCFTINVQGKGCHGSTPNLGIDSITLSSRILLGLQEISAREISSDSEKCILTVGLFRGGTSGNVIAENTVMQGTLRTFSDETREKVKKRIVEITENIANAYRTKACVSFDSGCPTLENDPDLTKEVEAYTTQLLGKSSVVNISDLGETQAGGSEDFAYIGKCVPSVMLGIAAGEPQNGFMYRQHNPKVAFDEDALKIGCAVMVFNALKWLEKTEDN